LSLANPYPVQAVEDLKLSPFDLRPRPKKYMAMGPRRSRGEMVRDVLEAMPNRVTRVMYCANLSWRSAVLLLEWCRKAGLCVCGDGVWIVTEQGYDYVNLYKCLAVLLAKQGK
jgi:predicted transcriptional regulator